MRYNGCIAVTMGNRKITDWTIIMEDELGVLAEKLLDLHAELGTWERVGKHYGIPKITLWRIVYDGYEPRGKEPRRKLGLSEIVEHRIRRDAKGRFAG